MANLTNSINIKQNSNTEINSGDAIDIRNDNEINVKYDNISVTLNEQGELQTLLKPQCVDEVEPTNDGNIIINSCGDTAGQIYITKEKNISRNSKLLYLTQKTITAPETRPYPYSGSLNTSALAPLNEKYTLNSDFSVLDITSRNLDRVFDATTNQITQIDLYGVTLIETTNFDMDQNPSMLLPTINPFALLSSSIQLTTRDISSSRNNVMFTNYGSYGAIIPLTSMIGATSGLTKLTLQNDSTGGGLLGFYGSKSGHIFGDRIPAHFYVGTKYEYDAANGQHIITDYDVFYKTYIDTTLIVYICKKGTNVPTVMLTFVKDGYDVQLNCIFKIGIHSVNFRVYESLSGGRKLYQTSSDLPYGFNNYYKYNILATEDQTYPYYTFFTSDTDYGDTIVGVNTIQVTNDVNLKVWENATQPNIQPPREQFARETISFFDSEEIFITGNG